MIGNRVHLNEGISVQEVPSCPLCGEEGVSLHRDLRDTVFGVPGLWGFLECPCCHMVWLNPRPIPGDEDKLYEQYYTHDSASCSSRLHILRIMAEDAVVHACLGYGEQASGPLQKSLGKLLSCVGLLREMAELRVMTLEGPPKSLLLDVGCGSGEFLARMRDLGWEVVGVEPDRQAVQFACERFGVHIYEGVLGEVGFASDTFDAITVSHVIEHVADPIAALQECRRVLKPGGKLVVVTPNVQSAAHRLWGPAWRCLEPPRHFYLFSPSTLGAWTEQAGLRIVKLWTTARLAHWVWMYSRLLHRDGVVAGGKVQKKSAWLQLERWMFQVVEHWLSRAMEVGEEIVLVAMKSG